MGRSRERERMEVGRLKARAVTVYLPFEDVITRRNRRPMEVDTTKVWGYRMERELIDLELIF